MISKAKQLARDFVRYDGFVMVGFMALGYAAMWAGYVFELAEWGAK